MAELDDVATTEKDDWRLWSKHVRGTLNASKDAIKEISEDIKGIRKQIAEQDALTQSRFTKISDDLSNLRLGQIQISTDLKEWANQKIEPLRDQMNQWRGKAVIIGAIAMPLLAAIFALLSRLIVK